MASTPLRRNREFLLLWSGQAISQLGSEISLVAYPLLVLAVTGSPAKAGLVAFARNVPIAVLALPAGLLADRLNRRHLMVATDGVRALAMASIPIAAAAGRVPYALIVVVAAIDGTGFVLTYVAERGVLRQLVSPEQLREAVARNESRTFGAMLAGPPLGGLLFGIGRAIPFVADAASYAVSTITKLLIRTEFQEARVDGGVGDAREGLRWLWRQPFLRNCMLLFAGTNPVFTGLYLLVVVLAKRHGASSPLIGAIVAAAEMITPVTNSFVVGYRVALAPDRLQGRVQAASTLVSFSAGWLGPIVVGFLLEGAAESATILVLTGWALVLALAATGSRALRHPPTLEGPAAPSMATAS